MSYNPILGDMLKKVILNIQSKVGPCTSGRQAVGTLHTLDGLVLGSHVTGFALSAWSGPSSAITLWSLLQRPGFACQMYFMTLINIHTYPEHLDRKWSLKAPCNTVLPLLQARGTLSETHTLRKQAASLLDLMHTHSDQSIFIWSTYLAWNQA